MKKICYLLLPLALVLAFPSLLSAQSAFSVLLPGLVPASKRSVVTTPDGGFCILARDSSSTMVLAKLTSEGLVEWERRFPVESMDISPMVLRRTDDGGFLVMGEMDTSVHRAPEEIGGYYYEYEPEEPSIFLMRLNEHGYPLWGKRYVWMHGTDLAVNDRGDIVVTGLSAFDRQSGSVYADTEAKETETADSGDEEKAEEEYGYEGEKEFRPVVLQIDRDGEPVRSLALNGLFVDDYTSTYGSGAVCLRSSGEIIVVNDFDTIMDDIIWVNGPDTSINTTSHDREAIITLTREGKVKYARQIPEFRIDDEDDYTYRSLSCNDLYADPAGGFVLGGGIAVGYGGECSVAYAHRMVIACNANGEKLWDNVSGLFWEGSSSSLLPLGDCGVLVASSGYYGAYQADIALLDGKGIVVDEKGLTRENEETGEAEEITFGDAYLSYAATEDGGLVLVGKGEEEGPSGILVSRLAPDITSCIGTFKSLLEEAEEEEDAWSESTDEESGESEETVEIVGSFGESEEADSTEASHEPDYPDPALNFPISPTLVELDPRPVEIRVDAVSLGSIAVKDMEIDVRFLCREELIGSASAAIDPNEPTNGASDSLLIRAVPNNVRRGGTVKIELNLKGATKPRITLVNIATGDVVAEIDPKNVAWSPRDGIGGATLATDGITPGAYLVRAQSGEKGGAVKIEVQ